MLNTLKNLLGFGPKVDFAELVKQGAVIVDVRTPGEYASGHIRGSVNIPLQSLSGQLTKIKKDNEKRNDFFFFYSRRLVADGADPIGVVVTGYTLMMMMSIAVFTTRFTHPLATRLAQRSSVDDPSKTRPTPSTASTAAAISRC